jgi:hypothetical protein
VSPLLAPLAAAVLLALAAGVLALQRSRQRRLVGTRRLSATGAHADAGIPDILYFTGESCTICHVAQRPALERLRQVIEDVAVREIDVAEDPSAARAYRVMTLPTTVVLDPSGLTTAVNAGFAAESVLREQVLAARAVLGHPAVA